METEDYIYQDDLSASKYPLSRKHVIAISSTVILAGALYFVMPQNSYIDSGSSNELYATTVTDDSAYDELIDPTRSLTDILLTDSNEMPATGRDVTISENNNNQRVYTTENLGSMENYDEDDLSGAIALSDDSAVEKQLNELANKEGKLTGQIQSNWVTEEIQRGDSLSSIFTDFNIPYNVMLSIAENKQVDGPVTNLRPGNKLYFKFDEQNNLIGFVKQIDEYEQWHFTRSDINSTNFTVKREHKGAHIMVADANGNLKPLIDAEDIEKPAYKMRGRLVVAEVKPGESFSTAAHDAGLTYGEVRMVTELFKGRVQFSRHVQPGDTMRVLFSDDKGEGKINAIELSLKKVGTLSAYRNFTDDKYYDESGYNSAFSTFRRFPIDGKIVISSHFNPNRRHPVTGRVRPHNGTDFAVRVGTPIVAPADGVVEIAKYSRSAGYYIVLRHRGSYSTVYMHCSKLLVNQGQTVKIGQMIARSGNTGISTGPHLHYELRRNNRPINAMRVTLPANEDTQIAKKNRQRFANNVALFKKELHQDDLIAKK